MIFSINCRISPSSYPKLGCCWPTQVLAPYTFPNHSSSIPFFSIKIGSVLIFAIVFNLDVAFKSNNISVVLQPIRKSCLDPIVGPADILTLRKLSLCASPFVMKFPQLIFSFRLAMKNPQKFSQFSPRFLQVNPILNIGAKTGRKTGELSPLKSLYSRHNLAPPDFPNFYSPDFTLFPYNLVERENGKK